jgi:hypothetical protein
MYLILSEQSMDSRSISKAFKILKKSIVNTYKKSSMTNDEIKQLILDSIKSLSTLDPKKINFEMYICIAEIIGNLLNMFCKCQPNFVWDQFINLIIDSFHVIAVNQRVWYVSACFNLFLCVQNFYSNLGAFSNSKIIETLKETIQQKETFIISLKVLKSLIIQMNNNNLSSLYAFPPILLQNAFILFSEGNEQLFKESLDLLILIANDSPSYFYPQISNVVEFSVLIRNQLSSTHTNASKVKVLEFSSFILFTAYLESLNNGKFNKSESMNFLNLG